MIYITSSANLKLNQGAAPELFERAREFRKRPTEAEKVLWKAIRARQCGGLKFRRQHPFYKFILDFYCHEQLLAIEIDGSIHLTPESIEYDKSRTSCLEDFGVTVIRFTNEEVINNLFSVLVRIRQVRLSGNK